MSDARFPAGKWLTLPAIAQIFGNTRVLVAHIAAPDRNEMMIVDDIAHITTLIQTHFCNDQYHVANFDGGLILVNEKYQLTLYNLHRKQRDKVFHVLSRRN